MGARCFRIYGMRYNALDIMIGWLRDYLRRMDRMLTMVLRRRVLRGNRATRDRPHFFSLSERSAFRSQKRWWLWSALSLQYWQLPPAGDLLIPKKISEDSNLRATISIGTSTDINIISYQYQYQYQYHIISYHILSYYITLYYIISISYQYQIITYHIISYHTIT